MLSTHDYKNIEGMEEKFLIWKILKESLKKMKSLKMGWEWQIGISSKFGFRESFEYGDMRKGNSMSKT